MGSDVGKERQLAVDPRHTLRGHKAVGIVVQLGVKPDEGALRWRHDIVIAEGLLLKIDLCGFVALQKGQQPSAVVVVRVGEKGNVHLRKVDAERLGVGPKGVARAGVEEDFVLLRFDVE